MSWADLFARAGAYDVTESEVLAALEARRNG